MLELRIVKSPTTIKGRTLKFGALYGKIDGIVYCVESFSESACLANVLDFEFFREREIVHTKKHGDYVRGGYWQKCSSIEHGKYANIVKLCNQYIRNHKSWMHQPTPYVRNNEISGAPKEKKAQNELVFRVAHVGYALSSNVITEQDAKRRIRPGVTYFPS